MAIPRAGTDIAVEKVSYDRRKLYVLTLPLLYCIYMVPLNPISVTDIVLDVVLVTCIETYIVEPA